MFSTAPLSVPQTQYNQQKQASSLSSSLGIQTECSSSNSNLSQLYDVRNKRISQSQKKVLHIQSSQNQTILCDDYVQFSYQKDDSGYQTKNRKSEEQNLLLQKSRAVLTKALKSIPNPKTEVKRQLQAPLTREDFSQFQTAQERYEIFRKDVVIDAFLLNKAMGQIHYPQSKDQLQTALALVELNADAECVACSLLLGLTQIPDFNMDLLQTFGFNHLVIKTMKNLQKLQQLGSIYSTYKFPEEELQKVIAIYHSLEDQRAVLIKLAERLQGVRELKHNTPEYQRQYSEETFQLYVPLAGRMGLRYLKAHMQDGCLEYYPTVSGIQELKMKYDYQEGQRFVQSCIEKLEGVFREEHEVRNKTVLTVGRSKSYYSILHKLEKKGCLFSDINDVYGIRVIVEDKETCYYMYKLILKIWKVNKLKDYIRNPKENGYQSLHVSAVCENGRKLDIQIRTVKQNLLAEFGQQAHWRYKEVENQGLQIQQSVSWCRYVISWLMDIQENAYQSSLPQNKLRDSTIELVHNCRFPEHNKNCKFAQYVKNQGYLPDPSYSEGNIYFIQLKNQNAEVKQCKQGMTLNQHMKQSLGKYWKLSHKLNVTNRIIDPYYEPDLSTKLQAGDIVEIIPLCNILDSSSVVGKMFQDNKEVVEDDSLVFV